MSLDNVSCPSCGRFFGIDRSEYGYDTVLHRSTCKRDFKARR